MDAANPIVEPTGNVFQPIPQCTRTLVVCLDLDLLLVLQSSFYLLTQRSISNPDRVKLLVEEF